MSQACRSAWGLPASLFFPRSALILCVRIGFSMARMWVLSFAIIAARPGDIADLTAGD